MSTLLALLALVGQPMVLVTELGVCDALVVAPGQALILPGPGACSLDPGQLLTPAMPDLTRQDGDAVAITTGAHTLPSGRVIITFKALEY